MPAKDIPIARQRPSPGRRTPSRAVVIAAISALVLILVAAGAAHLLGGTGSSSSSPGSSSSSSSDIHSFVTSPDGSKHAKGTAADPFKTIEEGLEALRPGDTLTIRGGTYKERLKHLDIRAGTASQPITVRSAAGAHPLLKGLLWLNDASYWHISGLDVTWSDKSGKHDHMVKFQGGTGWSMTDAEVWGARSPAAILVTNGATKWRLAHLYVHDTADTGGTNQDQLIYVSSTTGGGLIERCLLTGSPNGRAIKIGPPDARTSRIGDVVIRYNTMDDNEGPSNIQLSRNSSGNDIYRNILMRPGDGQHNITAFELEGRDNKIHDNLYMNSVGSIADKSAGLDDTGGNVERNPRFASTEKSDFHPLDTASQSYGMYAKG